MRVRILFFALFVGLFAPLGAVVNPVAVAPAEEVSQEEILNQVKEYKAGLKDMSRKERRALKRQQRKAAKAALKAGKADGNVDMALLVVLAILLPPLAVYLHEGAINTRFWISLLLTLLFFLPGIIYALIIILE